MRYFISYSWVRGEEQGFGNADITVPCLIAEWKDIQTIEKKLALAEEMDSVAIINYRLF